MIWQPSKAHVDNTELSGAFGKAFARLAGLETQTQAAKRGTRTCKVLKILAFILKTVHGLLLSVVWRSMQVACQDASARIRCLLRLAFLGAGRQSLS